VKKIYLVIPISLMIIILSVYGCGSTTTITQQPAIPTTTPQYTTYTMTLSHDKNPGTYPIYLRNNDILHLIWHTEDQVKVNLLIVTPSDKEFGFDSEWKLMEGITHDSNGGVETISTSDFGSGAGYYTLFLDSSGTAANVVIEYWIESK